MTLLHTFAREAKRTVACCMSGVMLKLITSNHACPRCKGFLLCMHVRGLFNRHLQAAAAQPSGE